MGNSKNRSARGPGSAISMLEQVKNATGIDLAKLAEAKGKNSGSDLPKELG